MRKAQYFRNKNFLLETRSGTALHQVPDWSAAHVLSPVRRLRERACTVVFDLRVQLVVADGLRILFLLAAGRQQPFTARLGPKTRLGAKVSWLVLLQKVQSKYRYGG